MKTLAVEEAPVLGHRALLSWPCPPGGRVALRPRASLCVGRDVFLWIGERPGSVRSPHGTHRGQRRCVCLP